MTHKGGKKGRLLWWWMQLVHGSDQSTVFWVRQTHARKSQLPKGGNKNKMKRENSAWFFNLAAAVAWAFQLTSKTSQVLFYFYFSFFFWFFFFLVSLPFHPLSQERRSSWNMSNSYGVLRCLSFSSCLASSLFVVKAKRTELSDGRVCVYEEYKKRKFYFGVRILWKRTCWNSNTKHWCRTVFLFFFTETSGSPLIFKG